VEKTSADATAFQAAIAGGFLLAKYAVGKYYENRIEVGCRWCSDSKNREYLNIGCNGRPNTFSDGMMP
jgi:hypothetical protein